MENWTDLKFPPIGSLGKVKFLQQPELETNEVSPSNKLKKEKKNNCSYHSHLLRKRDHCLSVHILYWKLQRIIVLSFLADIENLNKDE